MEVDYCPNLIFPRGRKFVKGSRRYPANCDMKTDLRVKRWSGLRRIFDQELQYPRIIMLSKIAWGRDAMTDDIRCGLATTAIRKWESEPELSARKHALDQEYFAKEEMAIFVHEQGVWRKSNLCIGIELRHLDRCPTLGDCSLGDCWRTNDEDMTDGKRCANIARRRGQ